jgi:hypothetical protein
MIAAAAIALASLPVVGGANHFRALRAASTPETPMGDREME